MPDSLTHGLTQNIPQAEATTCNERRHEIKISTQLLKISFGEALDDVFEKLMALLLQLQLALLLLRHLPSAWMQLLVERQGMLLILGLKDFVEITGAPTPIAQDALRHRANLQAVPVVLSIELVEDAP